ncbi:MAG: nucleotidyltransferase domain-containing protein [Blastocatellia bacterium]
MKNRVGNRKKTDRGAQVPPDLSWYADAADNQKRLSHITGLCERIAREFRPERIILFGSQATGKSTPDSDIDLLVVMPYTGSPLGKVAEILRRLRVWMPVDLLVSSAEDLERRLGQGDRLIQAALKDGKVMYEAADR